MKRLLTFALSFLALSASFTPLTAEAYIAAGCTGSCWAQMQNYCPSCAARAAMQGQGLMPWGYPPPFYWSTGPMMYSNFYAPAPWSYGPFPGVMPGYFPGNGNVFAAKPNLYLHGPVGTQVKVKLHLVEPGSNWLVAIPKHGAQGWQVTLAEKEKLRTGGATYGYLYSDYRTDDKELQDEAGFCASKDKIIAKMALQMKRAGFTGREAADFMEYWSVKLPQSESFCVYPQDERQLDRVAKLEITPKPAVVRRVLFLVQVKEGLHPGKGGEKFAQAPKKEWNPPALRLPASASKALVVHEWGVGFLASKPSSTQGH